MGAACPEPASQCKDEKRGATCSTNHLDATPPEKRMNPNSNLRCTAEPLLTHLETRHLVINMDVNKTIIMTDAITGKTLKDIVNDVLSNASWGEEVDGKWVHKVGQEPSILRPCIDGVHSLVSYAEWVNKKHPGADSKQIRCRLNHSFTQEGQPGYALRKYADSSYEALQNPDGTAVRILPSFFELMIWLKRGKRSFTICFRTFGEDLPDIAEELSMFCEGRHPLYPWVCFDGSDGEPDYRLSVDDIERFGTFHRDNSTGVSLVMGTEEQPGEGRYKDVKDRSMAFYRDMPGVKIISGFADVRDFLTRKCAECGTLGLRDYFQYWKSKGMTAEGGKLFLYHASRSTGQHEMFFDDNIHYSDSYIVHPIDVREPARTHWVVPLLQTHLCRAEPLESMPDKTYFIRQVERLEAGYERKLVAKERLTKIMRKVKTLAKIGKGRVKNNGQKLLPDYDAWQYLRHNDNELSLCVLTASDEEAHTF